MTVVARTGADQRRSGRSRTTRTMTGQERTTTVGQLPTLTGGKSRVPAVLTRLVWLLWVASLGAAIAHRWRGDPWEPAGLVAVDGLTVVMWATVTFLSGVVHSYSRRYMAGSRTIDRFFGRVFAFTLVVLVLVAADHLLLFGTSWLVMGLVMADLIGHAEGWPEARAAASLARRYFLAGSALLAAAFATLWWHTGATTVSGVASAVGTAPTTVLLFAAGALLLAAMVQSALVPFHAWLLSSMTAPTPASALMHAGFVNAGGILLARFAPVVTVDARVMLAVVAVGAASALLGKLLKSVQVDIKTRLGCSTVGQMGFMIMQAGLGFFGAAVTHLVLHGFYKAYLFLSSGAEIEQTSPADAPRATTRPSPLGLAVTALTALAGGALCRPHEQGDGPRRRSPADRARRADDDARDLERPPARCPPGGRPVRCSPASLPACDRRLCGGLHRCRGHHDGTARCHGAGRTDGRPRRRGRRVPRRVRRYRDRCLPVQRPRLRRAPERHPPAVGDSADLDGGLQ